MIAQGSTVEFTARGKIIQGVAVEVRGKRWVIRATDGQTWRVPEATLHPAIVSPIVAEALVRAGQADLAKRDDAKAKAKDAAHARLAPEAARFHPGQLVEVHTDGGNWLTTTVVSVAGGKVTVRNPIKELERSFVALGAPALGRKLANTTTYWANRVRVPRPARATG